MNRLSVPGTSLAPAAALTCVVREATLELGEMLTAMEPEKAPRFERAFYWLSCLCIWLVFPITLAVTLFYVARVNRLNLR